MSDSLHTRFDLKDGIATITLHRPEKMNAWTAQMGAELNAHLVRCDEDDAVRAVVVTGAGRAFCAGADLERGGETFAGGAESAGSGARPRRVVQPWEVRKPIIAAINGAAVGVGMTLPLQYDLRVAAKDAKLGFLFVRRGVMTELSSTWILPRLVGIARAADLLLSGRIVLGEEAASLGLVNEAVDTAQVLPRALEIARSIAENCAPLSVALTKRMIWEHLGGPPPLEVAKREAKALWALGRMADSREGVTSFLEKRKPRWTLSPTKDMPEIPSLD
ncbi:MAG TPA: enoyl-CoA hydratase-related protein [Myxococcota bacterium]|nr:enoyl-CoA hydratase-related protein [Myxococcota bacterium]